MRRGQGVGLNVVVIAAIALLVLLIVSIVVGAGGKRLAEGTKSCEANGGVCVPFDQTGIKSSEGYERRPDLGECSAGASQTCMRYNYGS